MRTPDREKEIRTVSLGIRSLKRDSEKMNATTPLRKAALTDEAARAGTQQIRSSLVAPPNQQQERRQAAQQRAQALRAGAGSSPQTERDVHHVLCAWLRHSA